MAESKKIEEAKQSKNPIQRAWASGLFDGRIGMSKSQIRLSLESPDQALVERFHKVIGVGKVMTSERARDRSPLFTTWIWQTYTLYESWAAVRYVLPLLSPKKKKQAIEFLKRIEAKPLWLRKYSHLSFTRKPVVLPDNTDAPADPDLL